MRVLAVAAVLGAALLTACAGDGRAASPGPTVPTEPEVAATTTSTTTLSYDVPETIDQAYVQRVVSAYDKVLGDAIRILVRDRGVTEEFLKHLLAIYTEPEFEVQQRLWIESSQTGGLERRKDVPADPGTAVLQVVEATRTCVITRVDRDFGPTFRDGEQEVDPPEDDYIVLVQKRPGRDPLMVNPTPWVMSFDGFKNDNSVPRNSCGD